MGAGDCLLINTNYDEGGNIQSHLFVIILDYEEHTKNTIVVYVQSLRSPKADKTTVLHLGDHEFIKHDSYINYRQAQIVSAIDLEQMILEGKAVPMAPMEGGTFQKICDGILKSPFTPMDVRAMYQENLYRKLKS
jgi:hypothetical protein